MLLAGIGAMAAPPPMIEPPFALRKVSGLPSGPMTGLPPEVM